MSPQILIAVLAVYSVLLIVGGLIGYLKAGSRPSLIAGLVCGAVALLAAGWAWSGGPGLYLGLGLAVAMIIVFASRLRKTKKFMPSGLLLVISAIVLVLLGYGLFVAG